MDVVKPSSKRPNYFMRIGVPLSLFIILAAIFLWQNLRKIEQEHMRHQLRNAAIILENPIKNSVSNHVMALLRMGKRWEESGGISKENWYADVNNYFNDAKIFVGIAKLSPQMQVQWIVPKKMEQFIGYDLSKFPSRSDILTDARNTKKTLVSPIFNLLSGQRGFFIAVPLYVGSRFDGYLTGSIDVQKLFGQIFNKGFGNEYGIAVYQEGIPVYSTTIVPIDPLLVEEHDIGIANINWKIYIWPTEKLIDKIFTPFPLLVLMTGLLTAILLLIIFYFFDKSQRLYENMHVAKKLAEESKERFEKILGSVNEGFIAFDQDCKVIYWNKFAEKILGWDAKEALNKNIHDLVIPERFRAEHREGVKKFLATGVSEFFNKEEEFLVQNKNGKEIPIETVIFPLLENNKYIFYAFVRDITTRKKAEIDQAKLASIVDGSDDAIVNADLGGKILTWNHGAEKLHGYKAEEAIGKVITIIYPEDEKLKLDEALRRIKEGEHIIVHDTFRLDKAGNKIPVSVTITPIKNKRGKIISAASITRDITERKKIDKMKNEFISIVSHELRTPLTSIRGSLGILLSEKLGNLPTQAKQLLEIANQNCERLIRLINDILDVEKIEAGKMDFHFQKINLNKLVEESIAATSSLAEKKHVAIKLTYEETFTLNLDVDRIMQVMTNLLSNAIRYSPENEIVWVELQNKQDKVRVAVIDSGAGIGKEFHGKIFEKFSQVDSSDTRKKEGTGLGLNISKLIIEKHKGKMNFVSEAGKGARFYFDLPLITTITDKNEEIQDNRVLICDKNYTTANYLKNLLEKNNIKSDVVFTEIEAVQMIANNPYSLIMLDLLVSEQDPGAFIKSLRYHALSKEIPICIICVEPNRLQDKLKGDYFPIIDWFEKPVNKDDYQHIVNYINVQYQNSIPNILSIEDNQDITKLLTLLLHNKAKVYTADTIAAAKKLIEKHELDLIVLDLNLPDGYGTQLLPCINKKTGQPIPVVVFSIDQLDKKYKHLVREALLKSKVSNEQLVSTIQSLLANKKNTTEEPA